MYVSMDGFIAIARIAVERESVLMGSNSIIVNLAGVKVSALMEPSGRSASLDAVAQESAYMASKNTFAKNVTVDSSVFIRLRKDTAS
jgi:hypothetical protein